MAEQTSALAKYDVAEYSVADAEQQKAALDARGKSNFMKLQEGDNVVAILPGKAAWLDADGRPTWFCGVETHYISVPGLETPVQFPCPEKHLTKADWRPCIYGCQEARRLYKTGSKADEERAKSLYPKLRAYMNLIDRADIDAGVKVLGAPKTVLSQLLGIFRNPIAGGNFLSVENGFDIVINRRGSGLKTVYTCGASRVARKLENLAWLDERQELFEKFLVVPSDKEIYAKLHGEDFPGGEEPKAAPREVNPRPQAQPSKAGQRTAQDDVAGLDDDVPL